jgi:heme/copper-type cytochrome/quinol oxidase subunit 4
MSTPATIIIVLMIIHLGMCGFLHGDKKKPDTWNFYETAFFTGLNAVLLYWGGFFSG